jgi:abhydrolase domain-containing protein 17
MRTLWKALRMPVLLLVLGYVAFALAAPLLIPGALYYPQFGSRRAPEGAKKLRMPDGNDVSVLHLPNPQAQFTLWFFHGNAEDLGDLAPALQQWREAGFAVFAIDYPGYGASTGRPSEKSIYEAARVARTYLRDELKVPAARTIVFGRSLGGGPAVQMATEERVAGLVVQSAFTSVCRVVTRWPLLPFDQFHNERKIGRVASPVLIMHGTADEVIGFHHGQSLFAAAREPKRQLWIQGARHNDFSEMAGPRFLEALRDFSVFCAAPRGSNP